MKEYRVKATARTGIFKVFGPSLEAANSFMESPHRAPNFDPETPREIQVRDDSNDGDDSSWGRLDAK